MTEAENTDSAMRLSFSQAVASERSFAHFDLGLSGEERDLFAGLRIGDADEYNNFGTADRLVPDIARFVESLGNSPKASTRAARTVDRLAHSFMSEMKKDAAWVKLSTFLPTAAFDLPRWHPDGYLLKPFSDDQRKVVLPLAGASTIFKDVSADMREGLARMLRELPQETPETKLALARFLDRLPTDSAPQGHGTVFKVGLPEGGVHSEPPIHVPRLFMSVVPGSQVQIEELRKRYEMKTSTYAPA